MNRRERRAAAATGRAVASSGSGTIHDRVGPSVRRLRGIVDACVDAGRGRVDMESLIAYLASETVIAVNESSHVDSLRGVPEIAQRIVQQAMTPEARKAFVATGWKGRHEDVEAALVMSIANRASANIACLLVHGSADMLAIKGTTEGREPREIGLSETYHLHEAQGLDTVRAALAAGGWRGAASEEDVDMRYGRLVTERALAYQQGDRSFVYEPARDLMTPEDQAAAEKAFRARHTTDYELMLPLIATFDGYMVPGQKAPFAPVRSIGKETWVVVDEVLTNMLKRAAPSIADMYPDGLPSEEDDLDAIAQRLHIGGDYGKLREAILRAQWRGLSEANVDVEVAKLYLLAARAFRDPNMRPAHPSVTPEGELLVFGEVRVQGDSDASNETLLRHYLALDAGCAAREKAAAPSSASGRLWTTPKGFDEYLMRLGVRLWNETYRNGMADDPARAHILAAAVNTAGMPPEHPARVASAAIGCFAAKWAVYAFQRIQTSHTFAAAMMATKTSSDCADDIVIPWRAFMVHVPNRMLVVDAVEFDRVLVAVYDGKAELHLLAASDVTAPTALSLQSASLADLLLDETPPTAAHERAAFMARRLVTGLLFAMQTPENNKERVIRATRGFRDGRRYEEPEHRLVIVGRPLTVDCREAIASYVQTGRYERTVPGSGKAGATRGPPMVQHLVGGHRKRQVCGVGRLGRKVIEIASYWRGPEDAPILTKPKRVIGRP